MVKYRDPIASITYDPIRFTLTGNDYTIPALSAAQWLEVLFNPRLSLLDIVPGLLAEDDQDAINLDILREAVEVQELTVIGQDVLAVASGRDWWITVKIVAVAAASWDVIGGEVGQLSVDWTRTPLGAWLDVVWKVMREAIANGGEAKTAQSRLTKFIGDMERSPNNPNEELDEEAEAAAFMQAMQMAS